MDLDDAFWICQIDRVVADMFEWLLGLLLRSLI